MPETGLQVSPEDHNQSYGNGKTVEGFRETIHFSSEAKYNFQKSFLTFSWSVLFSVYGYVPDPNTFSICEHITFCDM